MKTQESIGLIIFLLFNLSVATWLWLYHNELNDKLNNVKLHICETEIRIMELEATKFPIPGPYYSFEDEIAEELPIGLKI